MDEFQQNGQPQAAPQQQPTQQPAPQPAQQPAQPADLSQLFVPNPEYQPDNSGQQQEPAPQQQPQQQPAPQAQPQAQPQEQPQGQPQQPQQEQPAQYNDPYALNGGVATIRAAFEKQLDERFPVKGNLDINKIDKKDPNALAQFLTDMQTATRDDLRNEQLREQARSQFEQQIFEPVYTAFPKLRQDKTTDELVRTLYRGVAADNPNVSPVQVAAAFSNFVRNLYNAAVRSAQANMQNIPSKPAGNQSRATSKVLNNDVVEKMASGGIDDVAKLVQGLQGNGVGGL